MIGNRESELPCVAVAQQRLFCARLDQARLIRKEVGFARIARVFSGSEREHELLPDADGADSKSLQRLRQRAARTGDWRRPARIGIGHAGHRQRQSEIGAFGNAYLLADQPIGAPGEGHQFAIGEAAGCSHLRKQEGFAFIAEIHQRSHGQRLRHRPLYRPSA